MARCGESVWNATNGGDLGPERVWSVPVARQVKGVELVESRGVIGVCAVEPTVDIEYVFVEGCIGCVLSHFWAGLGGCCPYVSKSKCCCS